jgi:small-conductance mechanosensitive channel
LPSARSPCQANAAVLELAAALILAWIAISVVSRLIRNRSLGRFIGWLAWAYVALWIIGGLEDVSRALDQLAVRFGSVTISLLDVIQAVVVISVALWLASMLGRFVEGRVTANADLTPSLKVLLGKVVRIVLLVVAGSIALTALGIDLTALTVFSGALGVGLGFGLQKVVSNFVSGIIILLDKSIKPGDTISLGETFGWVRSLRSRFVSVMTRDGTEYLVPNEDFITQRVVSWSHSDTLHRLDVHFALAPGCDPHEVRRVATDATKAVERVEQRPQPVCHITKFDGSAVEYILRFWICDPQNGVTNIRGNVLLACWDAFKAAGFELALETRDLLIAILCRCRCEANRDAPFAKPLEPK